MKTIDSVDVLAGLGQYLADHALAQYSDTGDYLDHPDLPAVLFAGADVPDTALVLMVTGYDDRVGDLHVALAFRAPGHDTRAVDRLADAVYEHFASVLGAHAGTWEAGTAIILPTLEWGGLEVLNVERTTRGTPELSSEGKHKGNRYVRTDTYRITVDRDDE
ncbi:hypothetical protein AAV95_02595 [Mycolicibacterium elephantis]|uniref:hypothetical protein n=1 Tax=Mycolicibacterium elephantis TaxID=81858 RepID=UPI00062991C7|nr:hypothetical protein [Mycolicibacterium elephantis]KKW66345.1 hypothetical protein AAV95_02595 [Mycolicibacterium elephantis]